MCADIKLSLGLWHFYCITNTDTSTASTKNGHHFSSLIFKSKWGCNRCILNTCAVHSANTLWPIRMHSQTHNENRERERKQWKEITRSAKRESHPNHSYIKWVTNGFSCVREHERDFSPHFSVWASHCLGPRVAHSLRPLLKMSDQVCVWLCKCVCIHAVLSEHICKTAP